tara:strand:- start:284467 stop:284643 length:177 start_codon:yes stop_codon:yes gene_type:complete
MGLVAAVTLTVLSGAGGCYKEVVGKKGLTVDAHHPGQAKSSETKIDKAIDKVIRDIDQ